MVHAAPSPVPRGPRSSRGQLARRITLARRRLLLQRIRPEVERTVEDIAAMGEALRAVAATGHLATESDHATLRLLHAEQRRQQLELARLTAEYESLALRRPRPARAAA